MSILERASFECSTSGRASSECGSSNRATFGRAISKRATSGRASSERASFEHSTSGCASLECASSNRATSERASSECANPADQRPCWRLPPRFAIGGCACERFAATAAAPLIFRLVCRWLTGSSGKRVTAITFTARKSRITAGFLQIPALFCRRFSCIMDNVLNRIKQVGWSRSEGVPWGSESL